jgi:hypothetical protein
MQAVGQLVEVGEAGRHTGQTAVVGIDGLDLVERLGHQLAQRLIVLARTPVGDAVDLGLRTVDDVIDLALADIAELGDLGARVDEPAQDRLLADDLGVVAGVGRDRHAGDQVVQVRRAADAIEVAAALQLGHDGNRIGRLAPTVQVDDRVIDDLVGRTVEVDATDRLDDVGDGVLRQQHRAQHRLLGRVISRRGPLPPTAARWSAEDRVVILGRLVRARPPAELGDTHGPHPLLTQRSPETLSSTGPV